MDTKTVYKKDGQTVTLSPCRIEVKGVVHNYVIEETEQYFVNQKRGMRAASDLLLRKTLPEWRYAEKKDEKRKLLGAKKVIEVYQCFIETDQYIKKWSGILFLETKKALCAELNLKLKDICKKYGFENAHAAMGFQERMLITKRKRR